MLLEPLNRWTLRAINRTARTRQLAGLLDAVNDALEGQLNQLLRAVGTGLGPAWVHTHVQPVWTPAVTYVTAALDDKGPLSGPPAHVCTRADARD